MPFNMVNLYSKLQSTPLACDKALLLMLGLIIHGKELVTFATMNVYLEPFIEKLQMWKGVKAFDSLKGQHSI